MPTITLDLTQVGVSLFCGRAEESRSLQPETWNMLQRTLTARVVAEKQTPYGFDYPASWWQHFKQTYFPKWLLERFPVRNFRKTVSVETLYPFIKTRLPGSLIGDRVTICVNAQPIGSFLAALDAPVTPDTWNHESVPRLFNDRSDCDGQHCPTCKRYLYYEQPTYFKFS